ncbi:5-methylthioadenosine/S-adenosylhomocysteine deaminase [Candidatus Methylobacter favarea]|uniref:5-methylthioadenosine/S-adenosylhomocysteine deaminase n=1 Tax=Candidatus Methylobacter favarea TaxID=2707345 RepID=A0A8S0WJ39_9GAMM|nr:TRZ/ATZ family hydrolase [Candidatus Methylobacter favarea]CAA9891024.1 5-methylthioadenosine/S-adenosylhomocysteine deaminase [Candidatus Methylobacter favarea]
MIVDTLIHARWIIPVEPESVTLEHHTLVIDGGRIVDLLPTGLARQKYQGLATENLENHALLPGLINCHTHAAMTLMRGIADDLHLMDWLQNHIWPLEQKWMSEAFVRDGTDLAIAEMIRGGTTCFNDMYFYPEVTAAQAIQHGIRAIVGLIVIDFPTVWASNTAEYIEKGLALHDQLRHQSLISAAFAPHAPYTVSDEALQKIRTLADELELPVHMHLHETLHEVEEAQKQNGRRPLQRLHELGLINPSFLGVHMTQLSGDEISLFAHTGAHIVHCPESNLKLASGFCPVAKCLAAGINVALGTDGPASNNDLDMFGEMRTAALLGKAVAGDASAVPAMTALRMATINGARALGLDNEIGSLSIGKSADVIAIDLSCLETQPLYCPVSQIVYAASRQQVTDLWVAGRCLLKQRQLTTINTADLKLKVAEWQQRLAS